MTWARALATIWWMAASVISAGGDEATGLPGWMIRASELVCRLKDLSNNNIAAALRQAGGPSETPVISGTGKFIVLARIAARAGEVAITVRFPASPRARVRIRLSSNRANGPDLLVATGAACIPVQGRVLVRLADGRAQTIKLYSRNFDTPFRTENLNPPVPPGTDPGGVAVALIDTGLNYTLPRFANRLARGANGKILGFDFADNDRRPYDLDPTRPALFAVHHGTAVASVLADEAPQARLIPLRYPGRKFGRFADLVDHIARGPARIAAMPLGSAKRGHWRAFLAAARKHRNILFVASAGNDGRDIDRHPVYPAAFDLDNMLVVTSSDVFGRIAPGANWGAKGVDIAVPAERIAVIDHNGAHTFASGSSYGVPRIAALAARIAARHPNWAAAAIKREILRHAAPLRRGSHGATRYGWIPNPKLVNVL